MHKKYGTFNIYKNPAHLTNKRVERCYDWPANFLLYQNFIVFMERKNLICYSNVSYTPKSKCVVDIISEYFVVVDYFCKTCFYLKNITDLESTNHKSVFEKFL